MSQLFRVLYCSRNLIPGSSDEIAAQVRDILAASRKNNASNMVTGGLLFSSGYFAQVLEGPTENVMDTFERIQCDERHSDVIVLENTAIERRDFSDWSMAYAGTEGADSKPAGVALAKAFSAETKSGDEIFHMLKDLVARETERLAPGAVKTSLAIRDKIHAA